MTGKCPEGCRAFNPKFFVGSDLQLACRLALALVDIKPCIEGPEEVPQYTDQYDGHPTTVAIRCRNPNAHLAYEVIEDAYAKRQVDIARESTDYIMEDFGKSK